MAGLTSGQIREVFLSFFRSRDHLVIPSSSLVPPKDSGLLFTTAGVTQVIPFLLGHTQPPSHRLASVQKVFRTTNIEEVGDDTHHTFFEMLGNWSVGDYFKREAIAYAWELTTGPLAIDRNRVWVTVHPDDDVSPVQWQHVGVPLERIVPLPSNWWPEEAASGPCGPDSEMYFDRGASLGCGKLDCSPECDCGRFVEFWNLVFMQFDRTASGQLQPLPRQNVDTGMGLERMACLQQGVRTIYETSDFRPIVNTISRLASVAYGTDRKSDRALRIISDHSRAATFLLADNVRPANGGRGYVLRRIIRRAVRYAVVLGITSPFLENLAQQVIERYSQAYPELEQRAGRIKQVLSDEERRFSSTLETGMTAFERLVHDLEAHGNTVIPGESAFMLYDSKGLPLEVVQELAAEQGFSVDVAGFQAEMARQVETARRDHQRHSSGAVGETMSEVFTDLPPTTFTGYETTENTASVLRIIRDGERVAQAEIGDTVAVILDRTSFYVESGGQVSDIGVIEADEAQLEVQELDKLPSGVIIHRGVVRNASLQEGDSVLARVEAERRAGIRRNHTATHLLHQALRRNLGEHVEQAGSVVAPHHLTFDFTHGSRLTPEELVTIETEVNHKVQKDMTVTTTIRPLREAVAEGAMALFDEKYGDVVRVVSIDGYSKELCGGTHVHSTGEIGPFIIIAETGVSAGVRRIEALTGSASVAYTRGLQRLVQGLAQQLKSPTNDLETRVQGLQREVDDLRRQLRAAQRELLPALAERCIARATQGKVAAIIAEQVAIADTESLRLLADRILSQIKQGIVLLAAPSGDRAQLLVAVSPTLTGISLSANVLVKELAQLSGGGGGGGNPRMATGSGKLEGLEAALATLRKRLTEAQ
ncbi:MAG: alanine--tRNA ligase [Chloroflexi bacterium]|nr:alanine--tRNA ligase [Chloroflexota bacterium]